MYIQLFAVLISQITRTPGRLPSPIKYKHIIEISEFPTKKGHTLSNQGKVANIANKALHKAQHDNSSDRRKDTPQDRHNHFFLISRLI